VDTLSTHGSGFFIHFRYNPELFFGFIHLQSISLLNPAHIASHYYSNGCVSTIITNVDGLHTRAGARNVLEVHGTLSTLTCIRCFIQVPSDAIIQEYISDCRIPHCQVCGGILKPDVILYEEQLPVRIWTKAEEACRKCDLLLVAGTSLEVMPSAKLPFLPWIITPP
jgi:NAD-dependent deacetylase